MNYKNSETGKNVGDESGVAVDARKAQNGGDDRFTEPDIICGSGKPSQIGEELLKVCSQILQELKFRNCATKPFLTMKEAAYLIDVKEKTLRNIISDEKRRLGRLPDFVCNASGKIGMGNILNIVIFVLLVAVLGVLGYLIWKRRKDEAESWK